MKTIDFIEECYRLLKKGGRLVLSDFFLTTKGREDKNHFIKKWKDAWAVPDFVTLPFLLKALKTEGLSR